MPLVHFFATATNKETGRPLDGVIIKLLKAGVEQQLYRDRALTPQAQLITGLGFDPLTGGSLYPNQGIGEANCYVEAGNYDINYFFNGQLIDVQPDFPVFGSDYTESTGASFVGFINTGTGAVPVTVEEKLREWGFSATDFDAVGDGAAVDTVFIQNLLNAHATAQAAQSDQAASPNIINFTGPVIELPAGIYLCDNLAYNGATLRMRSSHGAMIKFRAGQKLTATNVGALDLYGVTFVGGAGAILVKNNNLDGAQFVVDRCRFMDQTDWPINFEPTTPNSGGNTNHMSGIAIIRDCVWYNTNGCARTYFDKTVIDGGFATVFRAAGGATSRFQADRAAFESRSLGDGIDLDHFFGTPITNAGGDGNVWVDNYPGFNGDQSAESTPTAGYLGGTAVVSYGGGVFAHHCRFGAEEGGMPIIRNWCHGNGLIAGNGNVHLEVTNCGLMAPGNGGPADKRGVIVLKKGIPNSIRIVGGSGPLGAPYINATAMLDLAGTASNIAYWLDAARMAQQSFSVDIEGYNAGAFGSIPTELLNASVIEGSTDGRARKKILPALDIRGDFGFTNSGTQSVGSNANPALTVFSKNVKTLSVTVSTLPAAATIGSGARAFVSDSSVVASGNFGAIVAGAGANLVPVFSDGTNWRIG
jgi:hypothetical protein